MTALPQHPERLAKIPLHQAIDPGDRRVKPLAGIQQALGHRLITLLPQIQFLHGKDPSTDRQLQRRRIHRSLHDAQKAEIRTAAGAPLQRLLHIRPANPHRTKRQRGDRSVRLRQAEKGGIGEIRAPAHKHQLPLTDPQRRIQVPLHRFVEDRKLLQRLIRGQNPPVKTGSHRMKGDAQGVLGCEEGVIWVAIQIFMNVDARQRASHR